MESDLTESIAMESGASISARSYVTNCLTIVFDDVAQSGEKAGFRELILHDDNVRLHWAWMTTEYLVKNKVKSYRNSPYSSDLSLCDLLLFQKLKNQLRGIQFNDDEETLEVLNRACGCLTEGNFQNRFDSRFSRMQKCVDVGREYFEKKSDTGV